MTNALLSAALLLLGSPVAPPVPPPDPHPCLAAGSGSGFVSPAGTPAPTDVSWWLIAVPLLALLALAAAGTYLLIQRTEYRPS